MKKKNINLCKISIIGILTLLFSSSCNKNDVSNSMESDSNSLKSAKRSEIIAFFAWSQNISEHEIIYDSVKNELSVPNTFIKENYLRVELELEKANLYKKTFNLK